MRFGSPVPVLRSFDNTKAREFFIGFLGFSIDWEHRFEDDLPLNMQISRGDCVVHLSEHHGDACPGGTLRIPVDDIDGFHAFPRDKKDKFARPGIEETSFGSGEIGVTDPFGNRLVFAQAMAERS